MPDSSVPQGEPLHNTPLFDLLDRPIAFQRVYATITGSATAGLMLSQAVYWTRIKLRDEPESGGWFWKTQAEWTEETALSRSEQETARKALRQTTFYQEVRRGLPAKLYFRVDLEELARVILQLPPPRPLRGKNPQLNRQNAENLQTSLPPPSTQDREDPADQPADFPQPITETTAETMPESTPEISFNVEANVGKDRVKGSWPLRLNARQQVLLEELEDQLDAHSRGAFCRIVSDRGLGEDVAYRVLREAMEAEDAGRIKTSLSQYFIDACQREAQRQGIDLGFMSPSKSNARLRRPPAC